MGYFDKLSLDPTLFRPLEPEPVESRGLLRGAADLGIEAVSGVARGVKFTADAFGADNAVSSAAGAVDEYAREYLSAEAKQDDQRAAAIMAAAEDAGIWEQVKAAAQAFAQRPVRTAVNALGTSVPTIAATMIPGFGQASAAARLGMLGSMGAVQGAGVVKGAIYEAVKAEQMKDGLPEDEAEAIASRAQEYGGENTANIAGGMALGAAATATGAQPIIAKMLRPSSVVADAAQDAAERGILARTALGIGAEAIPEAAQGGQEQYARNVALQNEGFDVPTWRGVAGQATLEGLASAPVGGVFGALDRSPKKAEPIADIAPILSAGSIDEAINAASDAISIPVGETQDLTAAEASGQILLPPEQGQMLKPGQRVPSPNATEIEPESIIAPRVGDFQYTPPAGTATEMLPVGETAEIEDIPVGEVLDGDITTLDGFPFGSKTAANVRAVKEGLTAANVVEIPGAGWVIRPQLDAQPTTLGTTIEGRPNNTRGTTAADVLRTPDVAVADVDRTAPLASGAGDVVGADAGRGGRDIRPDVDADRGIPVAAPAPVPSSGTAVAVGDGSVGSPNTLTLGATVTLDNKSWRVVESTPAAVKLADGEGSSKFISVGSRTWAKIAPATTEAATEVTTEVRGTPAPAVASQPDAEQLTAAPVAGSQAPGRSADGDGGVATTRAGSEPQMAPKVGELVKLTKPGLNGRVNIAGTVSAILPDGRLEIRTQNDGIMKVAPGDLGHKPKPAATVAPAATPQSPVDTKAAPTDLEQYGVLREFNGRWQYKAAIGSTWLTANRKEDAVERAAATLESTPEAERLTTAQRGEKADQERMERQDTNLKALTIPQLEKRLSSLGGTVASLQKAGAREFTGNGGRRTSAAVSNEGARATGQEKLDLAAYIEWRKQKEAPALTETAARVRDTLKGAEPKAKVYKTRLAATVARKELGNTKRLKKVKDGFILRDATDKELAAADKAGRRLASGGGVDVENDSLLTAIAKLGGLNMKERPDTVGSGNRNVGGKMLFRLGGKSIDTLATEALQEFGYIPSGVRGDPTNWLRSAIAAEFMGTQSHYSEQGTEWMQSEQASAEGLTDDELEELSADDLLRSGYTEATPEVQALSEQMLAEAEALGIDTEAIREDAARLTEGQKADDYQLAVQEAARQAIAQAHANAQGRDAGSGQAGEQDRGIAAAGEGQAEGLTLEAQTAEDLRAKTEREDQAKAAEAKARAAEQERLRKEALGKEVKARADQTVDDFQLGQDAEQQLSGQGDIFGAATETPAPETSTSEPTTAASETARPARDETTTQTIALRKRMSVLRSLLDCMG